MRKTELMFSLRKNENISRIPVYDIIFFKSNLILGNGQCGDYEYYNKITQGKNAS